MKAMRYWANAKCFLRSLSTAGSYARKDLLYTTVFTELHQRLLRKISDLQLVWVDDVRDRVVDMQAIIARSNEIAQSAISKFKHEAIEILCSLQNIEEMLNLDRSEQAQLLNNLQGGMLHGMAKILDQLSQLKQQKDNGQMSYRRTAGAKLRKALEPEIQEKIDARNIEVDWNHVIGSGSFGKVYAAQLLGVGDIAVKLIPATPAAQSCFVREVASLQRVAVCREVLRIYGWSEITDPSTNTRYLAAITDLCSRSLTSTIEDLDFEPPFSLWLNWFLQISSAMAFVASKGMYHRDLKPDNVLITTDNRAVISDFWSGFDQKYNHAIDCHCTPADAN